MYMEEERISKDQNKSNGIRQHEQGARKWVRLFVYIAFHMILIGLLGAILIHAFGLAHPEKLLFLPSFMVAAVIGVFYTWDSEGNRVVEAGNFAGILTAVRLLNDIAYPATGIDPWAYLSVWPIWGSYLANFTAILLAGWLTERWRIT